MRKDKVCASVVPFAGGATLLDWPSQRVFAGIPKEAISDRGDVPVAAVDLAALRRALAEGGSIVL